MVSDGVGLLMAHLNCPSCSNSLLVPTNQLGRALPCPTCQTVLVAVESNGHTDGLVAHEKQMVLIQAPVVLDAIITCKSIHHGSASPSPVRFAFTCLSLTRSRIMLPNSS